MNFFGHIGAELRDDQPCGFNSHFHLSFLSAYSDLSVGQNNHNIMRRFCRLPFFGKEANLRSRSGNGFSGVSRFGKSLYFFLSAFLL